MARREGLQADTSSASLTDVNIGSTGDDFNRPRQLVDLRGQLRALKSDKTAIGERTINAKAKVEMLEPMLPKDRGEELDFSDVVDFEAYADATTDEVFNRVTGKIIADAPEWAVQVTQWPLKGRTLNIPDAGPQNHSRRVSQR